MLSQLKSRAWNPPSGLIAGAASIIMMYKIDITNILLPARVVNFFNGFNPRLAIQQNSKNIAIVKA